MGYRLLASTEPNRFGKALICRPATGEYSLKHPCGTLYTRVADAESREIEGACTSKDSELK